jgi:hypothetical protein
LGASPTSAKAATRSPSALSTATPSTSVAIGSGSWQWQNPQPNANTLAAISCHPTSDCFVAGELTPVQREVTINTTAATCSHPFIEFWLQPPGGSWTLVQPYTSGLSSFTWDTVGKPAGSYEISVWAVEGYGGNYYVYDAYTTFAHLLTSTPCTAVSVSYSPTPPSNIGTPVTVTGTASGCPNPRYQFWFLPPGGSWTLVQGYSTSATYNWSTAGRAPGSYLFSVWARDASSSASYDAYDSSHSYTLTVTPCTSVSLSYSPASPASAGTPVTVTGTASGCPNPRYEFWYLPPGGTWTLVEAYSPSATYNWNTTGKAPGSYLFSVWARDASSSASYDTYDSSHYFMLS